MNVISLVALSFIAVVVQGQNPPPAAAPKPADPKPAAAKPLAAKSAAAKHAQPPSQVDSVVQSVKAGLSESLVIKTLQGEYKRANLTPADLVKLKNAGVSENLIGVMLDPGSAPAPAPAAAAAPIPAPAPAPVPAAAPASV